MKSQNFRMHTFSWSLLVVLLTSGNAVQLLSQTESTQEKQTARITLDFFSINNKEQKLVATVKTRVEGFFQNVSDAEILFYKDEASPENLLEKVKTDANGRAEITLPPAADTILWFTYLAVLEDNPDFRDAEREVQVQKGYLEIKAEEIDSVKTVNIFVGAPDSTGTVVPVEEVPVRLFVKRLFGYLPFSDESGTTDEEGYLVVELPNDIPGDESGNITLVARVSDHDEFGNLEFNQNVPWGIPIKTDESELVKELWLSSSNTSKVFLTIINLMLLGVLGVVVFIVLQLFSIKKLGLKETS